VRALCGFAIKGPRASRLAVLVGAAALLAGCGGSGDLAGDDLVAPKGTWQGTTTDASGGDVQESFGAISDDGRALFATYVDTQDPAIDRAVNVLFMDVSQSTDQFTASGLAFAGPTVMSYAVQASPLRGASLEGTFNKATTLSPSTTLSTGTFSATHRSDAAAGSLGGTFLNNELRLVVGSGGAFSGEGGPGSQIDACSFAGGQLHAAGTNIYRGSVTLDPAVDSGCQTGSSDPLKTGFEVFAYALDTADCGGNSPNTLVLGMNNGIAAYYFHRLCREAPATEGE
jgi:hypothetical protein